MANSHDDVKPLLPVYINNKGNLNPYKKNACIFKGLINILSQLNAKSKIAQRVYMRVYIIDVNSWWHFSKKPYARLYI